MSAPINVRNPVVGTWGIGALIALLVFIACAILVFLILATSAVATLSVAVPLVLIGALALAMLIP